MKISESSWWMFAIVQWIECRLTTRSKVSNKDELLSRRDNDTVIDKYWIYRRIYKPWEFGSTAILIPQHVNKVKKRMRKLWYIDFDFDSQEYALVKCYK